MDESVKTGNRNAIRFYYTQLGLYSSVFIIEHLSFTTGNALNVPDKQTGFKKNSQRGTQTVGIGSQENPNLQSEVLESEIVLKSGV